MRTSLMGLGGLLVLLAACGAASSPAVTPTLQSLPGCASKEPAIELPAKFPAVPLPPGTRIVGYEERSEERMIISGVAPAKVEDVAAFWERELPRAGFEITDGESEPGEAEASFKGNNYRGRWKVNSIPACRDAVTLQMLLGR